MHQFNDFDGYLSNTKLRRSIAKLLLSYLLCAQLVHGQDCPTLPCTESLAVYGLSPPPGVLSTPQAAPPGTSTTASTESSSAKTTTTPSSTTSSSTKTLTTPSSTTSSSTKASTTPSSATASSTTLTTSTPYSTPTVTTAAQDTTPDGECDFPCTQSIQIYSISIPPALTATPILTTSTNTAAQQGTASGGSLAASSARGPYATANATTSAQPTSNATSTTNCGQCSVLAEQVQVYYWPTQSVNSNCARATSVVLQSSLTYGINATKTLSLSASAGGGLTTDVVDGFTFTYPSLYVSVVGPLSVSDSCGVIGATYTNPPPVAVQAITTASYDSWPSTCRSQGGYVGAIIDTLAISDIACPTWGVSDPFMTTCDGDTYMTATYGAPYNPVILVPTEILAIDPAWEQCTRVPSNGPFTLPCGIYDPPRALHSATALGPGVTPPSVDPQTTPQPDLGQPQPANTGSPQLPAPTTSPSSNGGPPAQPNNDPTDPSAPGGAGNPGSPNNDPAPDPPTAPGNDNDPTEDPSQTEDPAPVAPNVTPANGGSDPGPQVVPQTTINLYGAQQTPGLGGLIYGGLGGSPPASVQQGPAQGGPAQGGNDQGANNGFSTRVITPLPSVALTITNPSAVAAAGSTLTPGGPAVTVDGTYYSLAPSGNLIAGTMYNGGAPAEAPAVLTFAGSTYTANAASQFVVAGQTLAPGAAITVSGTSVSLEFGGAVAVVGTSTQSLKAASPITPAPAVLTFAGSTYTANAASQFVVAGQTLTPGAAITVSGTPISLASGDNVAVVGTSTQSLKSASAITPAPAVLSFDGSSYTADASSDFIIDGQTLARGAAITVSGTSIFLPSGGSIAVIGSSTQSLGSAAIVTAAPVLTLDGSTYIADASSDFVVDGQTLTPGGVITVSGTPISYDGRGDDVIIGTSTELLATAMITPADILTVDGQVFTANPSAFSIDGTTISAGGPGVTISGTPVSLEPGGILVIGTSTLDLPTETGASPLAFEGAQTKVRIPSMALLIGYLGFCTIFGGLYLI